MSRSRAGIRLVVAATGAQAAAWIETNVHKIDQSKLNDFLAAICRGREVFALEQAHSTDSTGSGQALRQSSRLRPPRRTMARQAGQAEDRYNLVRADNWHSERHTLGAYRPVEPLKSLVFPPREFLGAIANPSEASSMQERIVIGVKNCDLSALTIYDHVFLKSEPVDPFYAEARKKMVLVSCDCTEACEVCFCPIVNEQPYAKEGFDINLSPTSMGFVIETGSERGEELLKEANQHIEPADESIIRERDANRAEMTQRVCDQAAGKGLRCGADFQQAIQKTLESKLWEDFAEDCVECGACNLICCTCHCFLLADGISKDKMPARVKQWDSCLYLNFARVAGGANPRKRRADRLYNRFDKKFNFFQEVLGQYACKGCGRCAEACAGKIDVREVLKRMVDG